jgi:hypothetical protein
MSELLAASMIHVDKAHLTSQFAPRVEHALHELWERNIIGGDEPKPLQPVEKHQAQWGNAWLASRWILPPPTEIQAFYATMLNPLQFQPHLRRRYKKGATSTPLLSRENPTIIERDFVLNSCPVISNQE